MMTISQHYDRAKIELADAYTALEDAQRQMQAAQGYLQQCELRKIAAEAQVQAYQRVLDEPLALVEKEQAG